ncbi:hypothetical protein MAR_007369 [Mya arenaria]|uniref:Uncharacterized protein n=1 Tax=Mya arenaria TaxID=6604 RepID=A0ABY7DD94_MYAAR|nr:hypothetical protein MAR_007369 [Mya arenaria]
MASLKCICNSCDLCLAVNHNAHPQFVRIEPVCKHQVEEHDAVEYNCLVNSRVVYVFGELRREGNRCLGD